MKTANPGAAESILQRVFANTNGEAIILCRQCGKSRRVVADKYLGLDKPIRVTCRCGSRFRVSFEKRRPFRKETSLPGTYSVLAGRKEEGWIMVEYLSRMEIGFRTAQTSRVKPADVVSLVFRLDDRNRSEIIKNVLVTNVDGRLIEGEFCDAGGYEKALGFYLMP